MQETMHQLGAVEKYCDNYNTNEVTPTKTTTTTTIPTSTEYINHTAALQQLFSTAINNENSHLILTENVTNVPEIIMQEDSPTEKENKKLVEKLVVPKLKLRVPKEFQKSVDAEITSSEDSENDDDDVDVESHTEDEVEQHVEEEQQSGEDDVNKTEQQQQPTDTTMLKSIEDNNNDVQYEAAATQNQNFEYQTNSDSVAAAVEDNAIKTATANIQESMETETNDNERRTILATASEIIERMYKETATNTTATTTSSSEQVYMENENTISRVPGEDKDETKTTSTAEINLNNENNGLLQLCNNENKHIYDQQPIIEDTNNTEKIIMKSPAKKCIDNNNDGECNDDDDADEDDDDDDEDDDDDMIIEVANDDTLPIHMKLERTLSDYGALEFVRICLNNSYPLCLYCNHARRIAVNAQNFVKHLIENHRFTAQVDSITGEELQSNTIVEKLKSFITILKNCYLNASTYNSLLSEECNKTELVVASGTDERIYECFMCRFITKTHKELYLHNRKMHLRSAVLCFMCRAHFSSFSEILCHMCPGLPHKVIDIDIKFRCCLCNLSEIPSRFRLMVHLRKKHNSCDVCLENCFDQNRLSSHVWKHKLRHMCFRCGIAYRNKSDIVKHLYWKHGTESINCKRCLQKRWRHVYHFCLPAATFTCDRCNMFFSKAMYLSVHARQHEKDFRYACDLENCEEKFISRRLLKKHVNTAHEQINKDVATTVNDVNDDSAVALEKVTESIDETNNQLDEKEEEIVKVLHAEDKTISEQEKEEKEKEGATAIDASKPEVKDTQQQSEENPEANVVNENKTDKENATKETVNIDEPTDEKKDNSTLEENAENKKNSHKKQAKKKRKKPWDFLGLSAPDLSESSDSSENDSDDDEDSKVCEKPEIQHTNINNIVPQPMEYENKPRNVEEINVMDIWKNLLEAQGTTLPQEPSTRNGEEIYDDKHNNNYPRPEHLHVTCGDHDYSSMATAPDLAKKIKKDKSAKQLQEKHQQKRSSICEEDDSSSSDSSSGSSCSCGTNCSCSSSNSDSGSSNSNSSDSDSSIDSNRSRKKLLSKTKEGRKSPQKKHFSATNDDASTAGITADDLGINNKTEMVEPEEPTINAPQFIESDLETSEAETDEDFYDPHPQKTASEMLAMQRAQIMAQANLSPTTTTIENNYALYENVVTATSIKPEHSKKKVKKRKRDKRLYNNNNKLNEISNVILERAPDDVSINNEVINILPTMMPTKSVQPTPTTGNSFTYPTYLETSAVSNLFSEGGGSSSEADGPLKRSKRQRRPNKFYGYTSDDESMGNSLIIGARAFKPQPPPLLTWNKDDLPTPSKSILNNKQSNKAITPRQTAQRNNNNKNNLDGDFADFSVLISTEDGEKRTFGIAAGGNVDVDKSVFYKRAAKKSNKSRKVSSAEEENYQLPPIPRLKIKPSQFTKVDISDLDLLKNYSQHNNNNNNNNDNNNRLIHLHAPDAHPPAGVLDNVYY